MDSVPVTEACRAILQGPDEAQNDHFGHTLGRPMPWPASPGGIVLPVGGGVKWDGMARMPSPAITRVGLFRIDPSAAANPKLPARRADLLIAGEPGDGFGFSIAVLPRPGADPWLVVGAPRSDGEQGQTGRGSERGAVYGFELESFREATFGAIVDVSRASWRIDGPRVGGRFGFALAEVSASSPSAPDLLVGEPGCLATPQEGGASFGGEVWRIPGGALEKLSAGARLPVHHPELAAVSIARGEPLDALGCALASGLGAPGAWIAIGAEQAHWKRPENLWIGPTEAAGGYVLLLEDGERNTLIGREPGGRFGHTLAGDPLANGVAALAIGAPGAGFVRVVNPADSGIELGTIRSEAPATRFGWALAWLPSGQLAIGTPDAHRDPGAADPGPLDFRLGSVTVWDLQPAWAGGDQSAALSRRILAEGSRDHLGCSLAVDDSGVLWAGALAWPAHPATEQGRVYALGLP